MNKVLDFIRMFIWQCSHYNYHNETCHHVDEVEVLCLSKEVLFLERERSPCLVLRNIRLASNARGQGLFHDLLGFLENVNPYKYLKIDTVVNPNLERLVKMMGYEEYDSELMFSGQIQTLPSGLVVAETQPFDTFIPSYFRRM